MTGFLISSLLLFLVWLGIYFYSVPTRKEQLIMSVVGLILSPGIIAIMAQDYRNILSTATASVGIEDLLFSFSLFGIAAVVYQVVFGQHMHKVPKHKIEASHPIAHWGIHLVLILGLWACATLLMVEIFNLFSVHALALGGMMIGIYVIADRHDLLTDALFTGLFLAILVFLVEQIFFVRLFPETASVFWNVEATRSFLIGGVPLQEMLWAAVVGFSIGPLYEWLRRFELK